MHQNTGHLFAFFTRKQTLFSRFALPVTTPVRDVTLRVATYRKASPRHRPDIAAGRFSVNPYRHIVLFIPLDAPMTFHKIIHHATNHRTTETQIEYKIKTRMNPTTITKYQCPLPRACATDRLVRQCPNNQPNSEKQGWARMQFRPSRASRKLSESAINAATGFQPR